MDLNKKINIEDAPILEFDDESNAIKVESFFRSGKKELWKFDEVKKLGIKQCIVFFSRSFELLTKINKDCKLVYEFLSASTISPVYLYKKEVLIALSPLGGPASANLIEELCYVGIKTFVAVGTAGCLDERLDMETVVIPTSAIRDEGISYHYMRASREVETSEEINAVLAQVLKEKELPYLMAKTWTTDAIYRETQSRVARRHAEGALVVEMECASLAAVLKSKGLKFGQILYLYDVMVGNSWKLRVFDKVKVRTQLLEVAIETCKILRQSKSK